MHSIEQALAHLKAGKMVILVDDEDRENEGDLVIAAEFADAAAINFMAKEARGLICVTLTEERVQQLRLPMMTQQNGSKMHTAFTVSIEAAQGVTTGISAADRARTIQAAIADEATADDIVVPGHVFPLKARNEGVLVRRGQTEGSVDLARLAGLKPAAVICEIMNDDGTMARAKHLKAFSEKHHIPMVTIEDLVTYRLRHEALIEEVASSVLPVQDLGEFTLKVFKPSWDSQEHVAIIKEPLKRNQPVLTRVHSQCLTGDVFASARCDCGEQLSQALASIAEQGGVLLYMRQEGRGIGLGNKIKAYALQDQGLDTVAANEKLGFAADLRHYGVCAQILKALAISDIKLMTNNPLKINELMRFGVQKVERIPLKVKANQHNAKYLQTKQEKLGHLLGEMHQGEKNVTR